MDINYQIEMEKELNKIKESNYVPTLLLHSCCAPCSSYVLETLTPFFRITVLYYNPNIYPVDEYNKRKEEEKRFIKEFPSRNEISFMDCDYDSELFYEMAKGLEDLKEGDIRCFNCYKLRLSKTAMLASSNSFDYFTSTLSISPYKNSKWLNEIGIELGADYNIKYLTVDFKKKNGYKRSIELATQYNLYRQDYCGCIYSRTERDKYLKEQK